jgi:hypothetical protein
MKSGEHFDFCGHFPEMSHFLNRENKGFLEISQLGAGWFTGTSPFIFLL